jgi:hypothetical protein
LALKYLRYFCHRIALVGNERDRLTDALALPPAALLLAQLRPPALDRWRRSSSLVRTLKHRGTGS